MRIPDVKRIFSEAQERSPAERDAFVAAACAGDAVLRGEVEQLLAAADGAGRFLAAPTMGGATGAVSEQPGDRIGHYRLLQKIGEGGFGVVWMAEQEQPVRRRVALKVLKAGMDTAQVVGRFEAERQALALMDHPHIAKVFDGGATATGRPYFVMELVKGVPITKFCDNAGLGMRERLELFVPVCQAVQHAHQKGVIHRDLKPSNVLVTLHDGVAVPKVIDFGIAKATGARLTDRTVFTEFRQMLGTPEYMAPEQAELSGLDVDTRADVYSLGVLLYELLTGTRPFEMKTLLQAGYAEMLRHIKEVDPPKPSTRVSTLGEDITEIARHRRVHPRTFGSLMRGDLDWIVMKAIEKERSRRYETATALAEDVQRHLRHEPVQASPPSRVYRWRKYVRRHGVGVAATAAIAVSLLSGAIVSTFGWLEADRQRTAAEQAERGESEQRGVAEQRAAALQQRTDEFDLLATVVHLEDAKRAEAELHPPWPEHAAAMDQWLREHADRLAAAGPRVTAAVARLEGRALPVDAAELAAIRDAHPRRGEIAALQGRLRTLRRGAALRAAPQPEPDLPEPLRTLDYRRLTIHALALVGPQVTERLDGKELEGLATARVALATAPPEKRAQAEMLLAWALFACGRDEPALAAGGRALQGVGAADHAQCQTMLEQLQAAVRDASGAPFDATLARLQAELDAFEAEIAAARPWHFANEADAFLHRTLRDLAIRLDEFVHSTRPAVEERSSWARRIDGLTRAHPLARTTWAAARAAIAAADGEQASTLYREVPIDLQPQNGLVPIGRNPATGLWEFYDLRSALDPQRPVDPATLPIPVHPADGVLPADGGIVFVLVPGGLRWIGAQPEDPDAPHHDPAARPLEGPPVQVRLAPFFLARHELTQAQWRRLSGGEQPSFYKLGERYGSAPPGGADNQIGETHPVEQVSWQMATTLLGRHGMELPTEAQWEVACRAGTTTPWWTGDEPGLLEGAANVLDLDAESAHPQWGRAEGGFHDGYVGPSPAGSLRANAWGFHDMHGNLFEWCRDIASSNPYSRRAGDGLMQVTEPVRFRIMRGGGYNSPAGHARASRPDGLGPQIRNTFTGVRPARALR